MKDRNSFRGTSIDRDFCEAFKKTKFYTEIYLKHRDEIIIGIRDGYINLYYNCDSIAKIDAVNPNIASIDSYYTDHRESILSDDSFVFFYELIKKNSDLRNKKEKQAQERLFIDNNSNPNSQWFCLDVEYTKSIKGKPEDWRFDIIAITRTAPFKVALIELKYGLGAISGTSGIRTHVKDFYGFHKGDRFGEQKEEIANIIAKLCDIGADVPSVLKGITANDIANQPEYYFVTLNNNAEEGSTTTPEQTMSGYLFNDKRWNCKRISSLVDSEGDYFALTGHDTSFKPVFLFSSATLPDLGVDDILDKSNYSIVHSYPYNEMYDEKVSTKKEITHIPVFEYQGNDTQFKQACRKHQAWFRENVLHLEMGENPRTYRAVNETEEQFHVRRRTVKDIAHLKDSDAARLMNFVPSFHREINEALNARYNNRQTSHDLMNDMLRSENIPWNIFIPMSQDEAAAINVLKVITHRTDIQKINEWKIEYNPETLGDKTSFDAFVQYTTSDNRIGIIGIEVKYTEEGYRISDKEFERIRNPYSSYSKVTRESNCFLSTDTKQFSTPEFIQIWRNHMLAISLGMEPDISCFDTVTVYPSGNTHFHSVDGTTGALEAYSQKLTDKGIETFHYITFEELFDLLESQYKGERFTEWIEYLRTRYIISNTESTLDFCNNVEDTSTEVAEERDELSEPTDDNDLQMLLSTVNKQWLLNLVDYSLKDMFGTSKARALFTDDAPKSSMEASDPKYYSIDKFKKAYNNERGSANDKKNVAYWYFCHGVKKGDIIFLAQGPELYGYAVVKGENVKTDISLKEHYWDVEWHVFTHIVRIAPNIATPFFVNLQVKTKTDKKNQIHTALKEQLKTK